MGFGKGAGKGKKVLVVEDAPAGVKAGKAAGSAVLAVATTHDVDVLRGAGADWVVEDLRSVRLVGKGDDGGWEISIDGVYTEGSNR